MGPGRAGARATILRAAWSVHRRQRSSGQGVVQHPVQAVPGAPVAARQVGHAGGFGGHGQVGDAVAHGPRGATAPSCQRRAPLASPTDSQLCRSHTTYKLPVHNTRDPVIAARSHRLEGWSDASGHGASRGLGRHGVSRRRREPSTLGGRWHPPRPRPANGTCPTRGRCR